MAGFGRFFLGGADFHCAQAIRYRDAGRLAKPDALVMHCLPAYRGKEIDEETFEAHADTIFTQAENRLHTQKAIMCWLAV